MSKRESKTATPPLTVVTIDPCMDAAELPTLLTRDEAGRFLRVSRWTVDRMIGADQLKSVRVGKRGVLVTRASVAAFVSQA